MPSPPRAAKLASNACATAWPGNAQTDAVLAAGDDITDSRAGAAGSRSAARARTPRASARAAGGNRARPARQHRTRRRCARSPDARPAALWRRRSAAPPPALRASAPRPYTVSVGNDTSCPSRSRRAARSMLAGVGATIMRSRARSAPNRDGAWPGDGSRQRDLVECPTLRAPDSPGRPPSRARSADERFSFHVGIGFGGSSGQGGRPDFRRGPRRDSSAGPACAGWPPKRWCPPAWWC